MAAIAQKVCCSHCRSGVFCRRYGCVSPIKRRCGLCRDFYRGALSVALGSCRGELRPAKGLVGLRCRAFAGPLLDPTTRLSTSIALPRQRGDVAQGYGGVFLGGRANSRPLLACAVISGRFCGGPFDGGATTTDGGP